MSRPSIYLDALDRVRKTGREHGYAIGLHGSLRRDLDLIAAPWTEDAAEAETLIAAICAELDVFPSPHLAHGPCPRPRPHGRLAWALVGAGLEGGYLDISVMPRSRG